MPTNQRLRANDLNSLQYRRKPAVQLDEKQPVAVRQPNSSPALALQHDHLLPERRILRLKPRVRSERRHQDGQNEPEEPDHPISIPDSLSRSTRRGFRYRQYCRVTKTPPVLRPAGSRSIGHLRWRALAAKRQCRPARSRSPLVSRTLPSTCAAE